MLILLVSMAFAGSGLDAAGADPTRAPPPLLFDPDDQERLDRGQVVHAYEGSRGRDYGLAAVVVREAPDAVWARLEQLDQMVAPVPGVKVLTDPTSEHGAHRDLSGTISLDQPVVRGAVALQGHAFDEARYVAFHLEDTGGGPLDRAFGYWSVGPYKDGQTLVVLTIDFSTAVPVPKPVRKEAVESALPRLLKAFVGA